MAADVRRWGGALPAHILQCGTHPGGVGGHAVHIGLLAAGHHGHPQAGGHCRHLAGACPGLGMPRLCAGQKVPDTGGTAPPTPLSPGGASAPPGPSAAGAACAGGFALRDVARSRSRVFTFVASRSRSLVTSANRDSASRLSSLALDRRASRSRLAASALIARASHAPARCCSTHWCTTTLCPRSAAGCARSARSTGLAVRGAFGGGGGLRVPLGAAFPLAGGGFVLLLDVNDVIHPHLPLPPHMDAHGKACHVHPLRPPLVPPREHIQPKDPSRGHRPLLPNPRHPRLHPPVPTHKPVGKQAHQLLPLGQVGPPRDHNGAGVRDAEGALQPPGLQDHVPEDREMPLPPIGPGRHLLGPGRIRLPGGQGDPVQGGVGVGLAQVVAGRHGHDHLARHMPRGGAGLAAGACRTSRAPRALTARTAGLARGPSTTGASGPVATGAAGLVDVLVFAPGVVPNVRRPREERHLQMRGSVQGPN